MSENLDKLREDLERNLEKSKKIIEYVKKNKHDYFEKYFEKLLEPPEVTISFLPNPIDKGIFKIDANVDINPKNKDDTGKITFNVQPYLKVDGPIKGSFKLENLISIEFKASSRVWTIDYKRTKIDFVIPENQIGANGLPCDPIPFPEGDYGITAVEWLEEDDEDFGTVKIVTNAAPYVNIWSIKHKNAESNKAAIQSAANAAQAASIAAQAAVRAAKTNSTIIRINEAISAASYSLLPSVLYSIITKIKAVDIASEANKAADEAAETAKATAEALAKEVIEGKNEAKFAEEAVKAVIAARDAVTNANIVDDVLYKINQTMKKYPDFKNLMKHLPPNQSNNVEKAIEKAKMARFNAISRANEIRRDQEGCLKNNGYLNKVHAYLPFVAKKGDVKNSDDYKYSSDIGNPKQSYRYLIHFMTKKWPDSTLGCIGMYDQADVEILAQFIDLFDPKDKKTNIKLHVTHKD